MKNNQNVVSFMEKFEKITFNDFEVFYYDEYTSFFHINLSDNESFYQKLFEYFFDEQRLLNYIENKTHLKFDSTPRNYASLYKHLAKYIDDYNDEKDISLFDSEIIKILQDEYTLEDKGKGKISVRLDKMGKIGEFIFCNILSEYFKFDCIIPKCHLTTDRNMNVYGIDTLYYDENNDMILFGESKLSNSLNNGIALIKKSLKEYESQIREEFVLVLSERTFSDKFGKFGEKYNNVIDQCISIEQFIEQVNIKHIGIPIFIAHGTDNNVEEIIKKLKKISKNKILGIQTTYFFISLPFLNKSKLIAVFTKLIKERRAFYEHALKSK